MKQRTVDVENNLQTLPLLKEEMVYYADDIKLCLEWIQLEQRLSVLYRRKC